MAQFPSLPLFTDAITADCHHLSDDEFGLYMRILIVMWRSPGCRIPAKAEWLERRFKKEIDAIEPILSEFCHTDGNFWTQGRLVDEMEWVKKNSKRQSVRSKSRWNKDKNKSRGNADVQESGNAPIPHPTPPRTEPKGSVTPISPILVYEGASFDHEMLFDLFWGYYPDISTKGNKQEARTKFKKLLEKGEDHVAIINGCREYAAFCKSEGQFNKHASTFLAPKERRWTGEWKPGSGREQQGHNPHAEAFAEGLRRTLRSDGEEEDLFSGEVLPISSDE